MNAPRDVPYWRRYLRIWGPDRAADIEQELAFHVESRVADLVERGMTERDARAQAASEFGDVAPIRRELDAIGRHRGARVRRSRLLGDLLSDVRLGLRGLVRHPAYTASMLATMALVICATTSVFSLVNGVLLSPLPYPDADALVVAWERNIPRERGENVVSVPMYEAWRERGRTVEEFAGLVPDRQTLSVDGPERVPGAAVTAGWFDVVGVRPALGRGFTEAEARAGNVVVLSHGLWRDRFGSDPSILGQSLRLTGDAYTVVGVMPPGFAPPAFGWLGPDQRYWVPFSPSEDNRTWGRFLLVLGRLAQGATPAQADAELVSIVRERARDDASLEEWTADVVPLHTQVTGEVRGPMIVLLVAVSCLLLIGIVNVTNLVLVRAQRRSAEFGVRAAIGAGRGRIARQLAAEAIAIALVAAPLGIFAAWAGVRGLAAILPSDLPRAANVQLDTTALGVTVLVTGLVTIALALVPVLHLSLAGLHGRLIAGGVRVVGGTGGRSLVIAEIALALVLTVGAGLTMRSFVALRAVPLGYDPSGIVAFRVALPSGSYESDAATRAFFEQLLERMRGAPGVEMAGAVNIRPLGGSGAAATIKPLGGAMPGVAPAADVRIATPEYFATLGIRRIAGEGFSRTVAAGPLSGVVNATLARALWPDRDAVGERFVLAMSPPDTVVVAGVVDDVRLNGPSAAMRPTVYFAHAVQPERAMDVVVRASVPAESVVELARRAVADLDPGLPIYEIETLEAGVNEVTGRQRVELTLLAAFSTLALVLAATGIYGVLAMEVGARRREIAVRLALGAAPARVRAEVVRRALVLTVAGLVIGLASALAATRFMASLLFGIQPNDSATYIGVIAVLLAVALVAAWIPARSAAAVDPMESMRVE